MKTQDRLLATILAGDPQKRDEQAMIACSLESFAREVDGAKQNELLTQLILQHSAVAGRLEILNRELFHSEAMLLEAERIAQLGRWDVDREADKIIWSRSMYDILEIDPSVPADPALYLSMVHPEDRDEVTKRYGGGFTQREPWTVKYRIVMKDGRIKWVHLRAYPIPADEGGGVGQYYGTIQDITEMKKAEDELAQYSQQLEALVEEKLKEISAAQMATIYALIKLSESRDDDTGTHIERTASFCRLLAQKASRLPQFEAAVDDRFIETIYNASPLHDIGKVGIPDNILLKPGKLTDDEFTIMKTHVRMGYETLAKVGRQYAGNEFLDMGMDITLYHHEKWDGSGYDVGLSGEAIPLSARIMAIADVYDALRSKRVYKEAFSHEKSVEIIAAGKGKHFDPALVELLLNDHQEFEDMYDSIV